MVLAKSRSFKFFNRLILFIESLCDNHHFFVILKVMYFLDNTLNLSNFLIFVAIPFVFSAVFFGTKNGYYNSDDYEGDGCAHDVLR